MCKVIRFLTVVATALLGIACAGEDQYVGDGVFVDRGIGSATERYILDFGSIDFSRDSEMRFHMAKLPTTEFVVGVQFEPLDPRGTKPEESMIAATVSMDLKDEKGGAIFHVTKPLREWTWSHQANQTMSFLYVRNPEGSFFSPKKHGSYVLTVRVSKADGGTPPQGHVVMKSGGWK